MMFLDSRRQVAASGLGEGFEYPCFTGDPSWQYHIMVVVEDNEGNLWGASPANGTLAKYHKWPSYEALAGDVSSQGGLWPEGEYLRICREAGWLDVFAELYGEEDGLEYTVMRRGGMEESGVVGYMAPVVMREVRFRKDVQFVAYYGAYLK